MDKKKKRVVKIIMIIAIIVVLIFFITSFIFPNWSIVGKTIFFSPKKVSGSANTVMIPLNKDTFPLIIQSQGLIQDIPKSGVISLKLYNFDSGQRTIEESYVVTKGSVKKGETTNPDISVQIHSKYISEAGDICSAIKKAKANGDLGYELHSSKAGLLLKYSGMMKYKNCF
jgi:hypothetical protein